MTDRDAQIAAEYLQGATMTELGARYGVTYQRIQQIVSKRVPEETRRVLRLFRLRAVGQKRRGQPGSRPPGKLASMAETLLAAGVHRKVVAEALAVSPSAVRGIAYRTRRRSTRRKVTSPPNESRLGR